MDCRVAAHLAVTLKRPSLSTRWIYLSAVIAKSCPIEPMDIPTPVENRLVELEIKAGFTEDLLDQLNDVVYRQQQQIDALMQELRFMRDRLPETGGGAEVRNLRDELPPHY